MLPGPILIGPAMATATGAASHRPVASPLRGVIEGYWSEHCCLRLCGEGEESRFLGRVRFLERHSVASPREAVEKLNRRLVFCPEDSCIVIYAAERSFYLLYRYGCEEAVLARFGLTPRETTSEPAQPSTGGGSVYASPAAPGTGGGSVYVSAAGVTEGARLSLVEAPKYAGLVATKVVRQSSVPAWADRGANGATQSYVPEGAGPICASPGVAASVPYPQPPPCGATCAAPPDDGASVTVAAAIAAAARYASPAPRRGSETMAPGRVMGPAQGGAQIGAQVGAQSVPQGGPQAYPLQSAAPRATSPIQRRLQLPTSPQRRQPLVTPRDTLPFAPVRSSMLTEPEVVNYAELQFVESLGSGEFGQVFRGSYRGAEVAIKQLYWDDTISALLMQDLAREIESFRHLSHRRLVRFLGACLTMPHPCLVTEYMPGGSLHHLLHVRKVQLPMLHAINMCLQVLDGVSYLHSQKPTIVHRDLKSLNVILDLGLNIKICDFGLTEPMERTHITKKNNGGSPRYMAPELFDARTKLTEKIDVWATGCIFIEIFGGPLPYETIANLAELTRELLVHRRPPTIPEHLPEEVRALVVSCLDFDHQKRPSSRQGYEQLKVAKRQLKESGRLQ